MFIHHQYELQFAIATHNPSTLGPRWVQKKTYQNMKDNKQFHGWRNAQIRYVMFCFASLNNK